jgi:hypothetical protein
MICLVSQLGRVDNQDACTEASDHLDRTEMTTESEVLITGGLPKSAMN